MTAFSLTAGTARRERTSFIPTAFFAEFLAGAREGLEIEGRYHALSRKSKPELAKLGLERGDIAQAALTGKPPLIHPQTTTQRSKAGAPRGACRVLR
jgi:hypothetical protein